MITIKKLLTEYGFENKQIDLLSYCVLIILILLSCLLSIIISNYIITKIIRFTSKKNKSKWNIYFYERNLYKRVTYVIPPIIIYNTANNFGEYETVLIKFATIYLLFIVALIVHSFLEAINDIYIKYEISKTRPIKGLLQVVLISIDIVIIVIAIATLFNKSPLVLLSGVGAAAAVFSFVFKDMILGFVAGIQLTANNMLRIGDWIEVTKSNAEGVVIDISLIAIKIQCFDKGVVTIPAYHLVSDSFKNWRPMLESGARRLKRSIIIDINSIKFCSDEDIEKYKKIKYLKDYI
ncbi:MAG TPA: mechanosensitive ion channel, partial [Clostridiales bacterium]|nr:mechanosensitive ion channel [Clostridiales bacterium]